VSFIKPNDRLNVSTLSGWDDFITLEPLPFRMRDGRLLRARAGTHSDGLSSPKFVKCDLQSTNSFFPTVAHDAFFRGYIEESFDDGKTWVAWTPEQYNFDYANDALKELAYDNFVPQTEVSILHAAVSSVFGKKAWDEDAGERNQIKD